MENLKHKLITGLDLNVTALASMQEIKLIKLTLLHHDFNKIKQIRNLGLDLFLKTVLCFYLFIYLFISFFYVSNVHLVLFVNTFVFLCISADAIIDFNFIQE